MGNEGHNAKAALLHHIERIEILEEQKKAIGDDIKEIKAQAKGDGFDGKLIGEMIKVRAMDRETFQEREALRDTYLTALDLI